ncbi:MAG: RESPONSE REGULATOR PROTEIN-CheY-like nd an HD-GYP domain [uncultured Gemmatimonadaceae bacterium]|uniref:RESPONSE REGULATOR PROTEIN-CheY-like nd an HD-GYP domain n=1 Tax=uncultured Gemmatimonadaceae bacterium TaxID=246130 RepID=A0A6J4M4F7_9BACT|nr:MAG: RESPONSE REGULATOR PROTEIN-CheY-like nd an HD-GYP domain [uncultured Gemmatimonadaceae bacterium]
MTVDFSSLLPGARAVAAYDTPAVVEPGAPRLLVVDDEATLQTAVARFLRARGYEVETAGSADAALEQLRRSRFALVLCDVRMPGASGLDLVPRAVALDPDLAVIMLSGVNDAATATSALQSGAGDYLVKPMELPVLVQAVERALRRRALAVERRRFEQLLREEVAVATRELEHDRQALRTLTVSVAETLINAMEVKDVYLRGHSQRVASLSAEIAEEMGLDPDTVEQVRLAGRLHDVGKIGIRESVLNKPGGLTPEEFEHVKGHVRIGMEILAPLQHLGVVLTYVHDHHERWNGSGYPRGLAGEAISIGGRILGAADAFDAITSRRAYREPLDAQATVAYLGQQHAGTTLDPAVYRALRAVVDRGQSVSLSFIDDL